MPISANNTAGDVLDERKNKRQLPEKQKGKEMNTKMELKMFTEIWNFLRRPKQNTTDAY